jgi:hypothetical protein
MSGHISQRCKTNKHSWAALNSPGFKCDGNAYPGKLIDPPVPCDCECHHPGARKPDDDVK